MFEPQQVKPQNIIKNNRKRKIKNDNDKYIQPPLKKQKQECVFCERQRIYKSLNKTMILTTLCCNVKMCGYCITKHHRKQCPNCIEFVDAHQYYHTFCKINRELRKSRYVNI